MGVEGLITFESTIYVSMTTRKKKGKRKKRRGMKDKEKLHDDHSS